MRASSFVAFTTFLPLTNSSLNSAIPSVSLKVRNRTAFSTPFTSQSRVVPLRCTLPTSDDNQQSTLSTPSSNSSSSTSSTSETITPSSSISSVSSIITNEDESSVDLDSFSPEDRERIENVKDLLEFWFSATNLRRDWYLQQRMDEEGWLDPSIFLMFNRIKKTKATINDIVTASKLSDELELKIPTNNNENIEEIRIRRNISLPDFKLWDDDEMKSSIILKSISYNSTIDSIKEIFESYGKITFIKIYKAGPVEEKFAKRALVCFENQQIVDNIFSDFSNRAPESVRGIILRRRDLMPGDPNSEIIARNTEGYTENEKFQIPLLVTELKGVPSNINWKILHRFLDRTIFDKCNRRIRYLSYSNGSDTCYVTLTDAPSVRDMVEIMEEKGIEIKSNLCKVRLLRDENELEEYWREADEVKSNRQKRSVKMNIGESGNNKVIGKVVRINGLPTDLTWRTILRELSAYGNIIFLKYTPNDDFCHASFASAEEAGNFCEKFSGDEAILFDEKELECYVIEGEEKERYWREFREQRKLRKTIEEDDSDDEKQSDDANES